MYDVVFWRVVLDIVFEGCDGGMFINNCFMKWLKICRVYVILGIRFGFFDFGGICFLLIVLFSFDMN